jgi:H+/Cl- antiporter ClcA
MSLFDSHMDFHLMTIAASRLARETRWLANAGLAVMVAAFMWWFLFYAQWTGPLRLLDLKAPCLVATIDTCSFFQSRLEELNAAGPAYHPAAWWVGVVAFLAGRVSGMLLPYARPATRRSGSRIGLVRSGLLRSGLRRDSQKDGVLCD